MSYYKEIVNKKREKRNSEESELLKILAEIDRKISGASKRWLSATIDTVKDFIRTGPNSTAKVKDASNKVLAKIESELSKANEKEDKKNALFAVRDRVRATNPRGASGIGTVVSVEGHIYKVKWDGDSGVALSYGGGELKKAKENSKENADYRLVAMMRGLIKKGITKPDALLKKAKEVFYFENPQEEEAMKEVIREALKAEGKENSVVKTVLYKGYKIDVTDDGEAIVRSSNGKWERITTGLETAKRAIDEGSLKFNSKGYYAQIIKNKKVRK